MTEFSEITKQCVMIGRATENEPCKVGCVGNPHARIVRVIHISDTHDTHNNIIIPNGDILIHSGDFSTYRVSGNQLFLEALKDLDNFFASQPHKHKIFVAGNHELSFCGQPLERIRARLPNAIYLQDNAVQVEGLKIYGSPWTGKRRSPANAFICPYPELGKYWIMIPKDTDILITHSPPHRIMDNYGGMGCPLLREIVLKQIRPMMHLFGHAHQGATIMEKHGIVFSNAAQSGVANSRPLVIDVYIAPDICNKTKTYRAPIWREDAGQHTNPTCALL